MKRILVPFDFSPQAIEAFKFAVNIAQKEGAEIFMLHSIEFPAMINSSIALEFEREYLAANRVKAIKRMNRIAHRLTKKTRINTMVDFGGSVPSILRAIKTSEVDLIVMGTQGASGLREITIGSNTEKIVRRSTIPVIAIRKAAKSISNIVFPFVPLDNNQNEIIESVKNLQQLFEAKLHIVFINTPSSFMKDSQMKPAMAAFSKKYDLGDCTLDIYNDSTEAEGIINYTKHLKEPMVAIATHGRRGISHLVNGSIAETVVNHIKFPISTFRISK